MLILAMFQSKLFNICTMVKIWYSPMEDKAAPVSTSNFSGLQSLFVVILMTSSGVGLMLLKPALFPVSSGLFSAGIAYFLHLFLGSLDQSQLDVDATSDSVVAKAVKLALKAKVTGPVVIFFLIWASLCGLEYSRSKTKTAEQLVQELIGDPQKNQLQILPERKDTGEVQFRIKMNNLELGMVNRDNLHTSLKTLADSAAKLRKQSKLTNDLLIECSAISGVCKQPTAIPVKVAFLHGLGANRALVCPNSPILAITKLSGNDVMLTRYFNKPAKPVEVFAKNIDSEYGPSPCEEVANWIQVDRDLYRNSFGNDKDGLADGFLYSLKIRVEK
jgi:hypothetical protein